MKLSPYHVPRAIGTALLITYAALLPLLLAQLGTAHPLRDDNGNLVHSVHKRRLDFIDASKYNFELGEAQLRWTQVGPIKVAKTNKKKRAEIRVSDARDCDANWIGRYFPGDDRIRFNTCAMEWAGGFYSGTQQTLGPTTDSRRQRAAVHEFGHALGLDHNSLGDCRSVLHHPVDFDQPTCWIPKAHDEDDMASLWR